VLLRILRLTVSTKLRARDGTTLRLIAGLQPRWAIREGWRRSDTLVASISGRLPHPKGGNLSREAAFLVQEIRLSRARIFGRRQRQESAKYWDRLQSLSASQE